MYGINESSAKLEIVTLKVEDEKARLYIDIIYMYDYVYMYINIYIISESAHPVSSVGEVTTLQEVTCCQTPGSWTWKPKSGE